MNLGMNLRLLGMSLVLASGARGAETAKPTEPAAAPAIQSVIVAPVTTVESAVPVPANALPAMSFYGSIASDELFDLVKKSGQFARIDKELFGSPLSLRVIHTLQPTTGGKATGLLSAIFTGGTLGLIPMVTNNQLVVTYEVRVHGRELVSYSYARTFTRAVNIWAKDETYGLGKDGLEWLKSTAADFTTAAAKDEKLAGLKKEYERYFGAGQ